MTEPTITKESRGPVGMTYTTWSDGSVRLDIEFTNARRQIAQLFLPNAESAQAAATGVTDAVMSSLPHSSNLDYEVSEHHSIEEDAMLTVHDADGPEGFRYKVVLYPPDEGRWGLARMYVFGAGKRGSCLTEGRLRNVAIAKCLADAMVRHWRK